MNSQTIGLVRTKISKSGDAFVASQVWANNSPFGLDWHVTNQNGRWLVTDVVVDGVSMKATQRSEFAAIIQRNGGQPQALLAALRQQIGQSGAGSSTPRR